MKNKNLLKGLTFHCVAFLLALLMPVIITGQEVSSVNNGNGSNGDAPAKKPENGSDFIENLKFLIEIGGQYKHVTGERPSKLEEYGQLRKGLVLKRFRITSNPEGSPEFFRVIGKKVAEDDQQYLLDFGKYQSFRITARFNGFSHLYSEGGKTLFTRGYDILEVDDNVQTTLQNTLDASVPAAVQSLYSNARTIDLKSKRNILDLNFSYQINSNWSVRVNWNRQIRSGMRPLGSGSYERIGTPTGDTFRVHSIELPSPTDSTTDHLTIGTRYLKENWGITFDYTYSLFKNNTPYLYYDNPFRATDLQATGSGGVFDRMKMSQSALALEPSNHSQTIAVSAFVDLPRSTRLAGAWSWSFWKQDEPFLPYGLNSAIVTGVPAGLNVTSAASLPEPGLNGEVDTFTQDYVLASRPWNNWAFNVHYRRYENDNKTEEILFPGYVAYLESYWRTNIANVPIENEVQSFTKSNLSAEGIWEINRRFRWKFGYEWEGWLREHRQAAESGENSFYTQFTFDPKGRFTSRLNYRYSNRKPEFYNGGVKEFSQLRMFDQARRLRHDVDWQWQYSIKPQVGLSGTLGYQSDDYDQNFFGLARYSQWYGTVDLMYMPKDNTTFYVNYSRENYKNFLQTIAKTAVPYDLANRWNREEKDVLDNFGVGVTAYALKDKMLLDLHYVFSNAKTSFVTTNPATPSAINVLNSTAYPHPDVKTRFQEFNSDISYQLSEKVGLGFRYIYQPYSLDDFAWNSLSPYPISQLPAEQDGRRFLLLDSRYSDHRAHIFGVYIRFGN